MKQFKTSVTAILLLPLICISSLQVMAEEGKNDSSVKETVVEEADKVIEYWNPSSPAMQSIVEFVTKSADENSDGFIPEADRIAVFDHDGTLY